MGWGSGSRLFSEIIFAVKQVVPEDDKRKDIYEHLITAFENEDWDTQDECKGEDPMYDAALKELHPEWFASR